MTGTIINVITVLIGGTAGLFLGSRFPQKMRQTVVYGLGLFTLVMGVSMFLSSQNSLVVLLSLLFGAITGELLKIEDGIKNLGRWLESKFMKSSGGDFQEKFVKGFLTASLVFCVGPMTILGSIQDGLTGDYNLLAIKSVLDGFAAMAFASSLGVGVLFSVIVVFGFQGGISLAAAQVQALMTSAMMDEMSAAGGLILVGLAISSLLEIKPIRTANFLPALVYAPILVWLFSLLGIY